MQNSLHQGRTPFLFQLRKIAESWSKLPFKQLLYRRPCYAKSLKNMPATLATSATLTAEQEAVIEAAKKKAAFHAVDLHIRSGQKIGVGTGSTARFIVTRLAEKFHDGQIRDIVCVPSSFQARHLIIDHGLPLSDIERNSTLDVCIDGADEVDPGLNCIKGGGGCLTQEKIVQSCSRRFVIVADYRKRSECLGDRFHRLPLEAVPVAYVAVKRRVEKEEGGVCQLRMAVKKAGPVITDNGNYVLDWAFPETPGMCRDWASLARRLKLMPGIVETGLFIQVAERAYFGMQDGGVTEWLAPWFRPPAQDSSIERGGKGGPGGLEKKTATDMVNGPSVKL